MQKFMQKTPVLIILIMLTVYILNFEYSVIWSQAPAMVETYGINGSQITFLLIGFALTGVFAPFLGYRADKFGLKRTMMLALLFYLVGSFLTIFTKSALAYFLARTIMGIGYYSLLSLTTSFMTMLVDYEHLGKVSGLHRFAVAFAFFSSPIIGNYLVGNYGFHAIYVFTSVFVLMLLLFYIFIPNIKSSDEMELKNIRLILTDKRAIKFIIAVFALAIPSKYIFNYLSLHLSTLDYSSGLIANIYSFGAVGSLLAGILILSASDKFGKNKMAILGLILSILAVLSLLSTNVTMVFIAFFILGIGYDTIWGLIFPIASKVFKNGKSTFLTILALTSAMTNVFSSFTGPIVNANFAFKGNIIASSLSLLLSLLAFYMAIKTMKDYK